MEPDEAVDALRDLSAQERAGLLREMPAEVAARLARLLGYNEDQAGGVMTTTLVRDPESQTVRRGPDRELRALAGHAVDLSAMS